MLTNKKSHSYKKWLYLIMVPVIGLAVMSFQQPVEEVFSETAVNQIEEALILPGIEDPSIPSRFPLDNKFKKSVTWEFGLESLHPITKKKVVHKGIDFRAPKGTSVYATANGIVAKSFDHEGYGKLIVLKHDKCYSTLFAHLNERLVEAGEMVKIGQKIGTVGTTGRSTGDHLHYEVIKDGENVDPAEYF